MTTLARALLILSSLLFATLLVLRVASPEAVVHTGVGLSLNFASAFALFLGLAEWKSVPFSGTSGGRTLITLSMFVTAFAVDYVLGLGLGGDELIGPLGLFLYLPFAVLVLFGWWNVIFRTKATLHGRTHPIFLVGVAFIVAAVVYLVHSK
jgi:hypothetical protein